jgi:hypothetical protein
MLAVYRHVARLAEAGILNVVSERRVRGITERTYTLRIYAAQMQPGEIAEMTPAEHASAFLAYVAGLPRLRAWRPACRQGRVPRRRPVAHRRRA